jgi:DNA-binding MarR family transcriptional regulator
MIVDNKLLTLYHPAMNDTAMFSLIHAAHAVEDRLESALGGVGLSMAKFSVLSELVRSREPLALSELAARLSCVRSNMTQLVDRLQADGLVERVADPSDRRSVRASLTDAGKVRQQAGAAEVERVKADFSTAVGDGAALERLLEALS